MGLIQRQAFRFTVDFPRTDVACGCDLTSPRVHYVHGNTTVKVEGLARQGANFRSGFNNSSQMHQMKLWRKLMTDSLHGSTVHEIQHQDVYLSFLDTLLNE